METNQPTAQPTPQPSYAPNRGVFSTKVPSSVAFAIGILVFFLPFVDIKCNNMSLQQVSGFQLATGFQMKNSAADNSFLNDFKTNKADEEVTKTTTKTDKKEPNLFAMAALGLGVLGLLLSFTNARAALGGAMATGILSAGALIGLMLDVKKKVKLDMPPTKSDNEVSDAFNQIGDKVNISVDFTAWFYIAVIAFLAAAFFCYRRMQSAKV